MYARIMVRPQLLDLSWVSSEVYARPRNAVAVFVRVEVAVAVAVTVAVN